MKNHTVIGPIRGNKYAPSCGDCHTPPWEDCACSIQFDGHSERYIAEADTRLQLLLLPEE